MSLIGIDVGSSSVKVAAYTEDGMLLGVAGQEITPLHPQPGWWEQNPEEIWEATNISMRKLTAQEAVRRDPPIGIAVSASGRENFLADADGRPLGNGIMGADIRGAEFEIPPKGSTVPEPWCLSCGHLRERMDPILRLMWWRKHRPEIVENARYFFGWYDFLVFHMTGRVVSEPSTVSRYLVYDLKTMGWAPERVAEYEVPPDMLPEVPPWGTIIGKLKPDVAEDWGLSPDVEVAQGCHDLNCCAVGAGVFEVGTVCLVSGSYENFLIPTDLLPTPTMLLRGLSVMPHPCKAGFSVMAVHPTGNAVMNWARDLVGLSIEAMESSMEKAPPSPSSVMAVPYLSGSMTYWEGGRKAKGALTGLSLATSQSDIVQAFMESIAYDLVNTLSLLKQEGVETKRIRITGGGSRSAWWTQLKADMTGMPIEVAEHLETGTLGAALLAGHALGIYDDLDEASKVISGSKGTFQPDLKRAELHHDKLEQYRKLMTMLLDHIY